MKNIKNVKELLRMPRKLTLNDELIENLCKCISNGLNNKDACAMCGVTEDTFYKWLREAEDTKSRVNHRELKIKLAESLKKAEAKFKAFHLGNITKSASGDWKASAWILERKFPKEFARIDRNAVVLSADDGMLPKVLEVISDMNKKEEVKDDYEEQ